MRFKGYRRRSIDLPAPFYLDHQCTVARRAKGNRSVLSVFITAVADYMHQVARFRENLFDRHNIAGIEREPEHTGVCGDMLSHAEARPYNYAGHRWTIKDVADTDIGDTHPMFVGDLFQHRQQLLEQGPSTPCVDHVLVLL